MSDNVFLPFCVVAAFADGTRQHFPGLDESSAVQAMEAAQAQHGDITWWDYVTDKNYDNGRYYATLPAPPEIFHIDLTDYPNAPAE